jgi:hypothetical protein
VNDIEGDRKNTTEKWCFTEDVTVKVTTKDGMSNLFLCFRGGCRVARWALPGQNHRREFGLEGSGY